MIAIVKNSFLDFQPVNLYSGTLSRSQSESSLCRSSSSSSSMHYIFDFGSSKCPIARTERTARATHDEVSAVLDAAKRNVDEVGSGKSGKNHTSYNQRRPDKKKRALFSQFLNEQKAKLAAQPYEFNIESVELPASLRRQGGDDKSLEQAKKALYALKTTLTTHTCL